MARSMPATAPKTHHMAGRLRPRSSRFVGAGGTCLNRVRKFDSCRGHHSFWGVQSIGSSRRAGWGAFAHGRRRPHRLAWRLSGPGWEVRFDATALRADGTRWCDRLFQLGHRHHRLGRSTRDEEHGDRVPIVWRRPCRRANPRERDDAVTAIDSDGDCVHARASTLRSAPHPSRSTSRGRERKGDPDAVSCPARPRSEGRRSRRPQALKNAGTPARHSR